MQRSDKNRSREEVRRQYLAACHVSGGNGPPDVNPYLEGFAEPELSALRSELEAVRSARQSNLTVDFPAPSSEKTVDHTDQPAPSVPAHDSGSPKSALGTMDFEPPQHRAEKSNDGPTFIAGYDVLGVLGRGAMGVVYKAVQRGLKRTVALKMILAGSHAAKHEVARFRAEAEAVAKLQHPNIVQIHEVGEADGSPYFSLEYVEGSSLDKKVRDHPLPSREAARICLLLAQAMSYAHQRGIIHRDLKPANVLLTLDGTPKISNFGLAKQLSSEDAGLTRAGTVLGTPSYMAPEQAEGKIDELGPLADVYSLGAILYDLLTGRAPFRGTTLLETLEQVRTREPVPPMQLQPTCPRDLETICLKCLQKDPARRYQSAAELADDLDRFLKHEPIMARPVSSAERVWRWCKRNPWVAGLAAAVSVLVIAWAGSSSVLAWNLKVAKDDSDYQAGVATTQKLEAQKQTVIADGERKKAEGQTILANEERKKAEGQTLIANQERKKAEEQTDIAQKNEKSAKMSGEASVRGMTNLGEKMFQRLVSKRLAAASDPEIRKLRDEVLATLRQELKEVSEKIDQAGATPFGAPGVCQAMGILLTKIGQDDEALQNFQLAARILEQIVKANPKNDQARANLGVVLLDLGNTALHQKGDAVEAIKHYQRARQIHQEILDNPIDGSFPAARCKITLSHDAHCLGEAYLALSDPAEARKHFRDCLERRQAWSNEEPNSLEARSYLMQACMSLGIASSYLADDKEVAEHFQTALALGAGLVKDRPKFASFQADLVEVLGHHGDALFRASRLDDAHEAYQTALETLKGVIAKRPDNLADQATLGRLRERLGQSSLKKKLSKESESHFKEALAIRQDLLQIAPNNLPRQAAYFLALARTGKHAEAAKGAAALRPKLAHSTELQLQLARCLAVCAVADPKSKHAEQALELVLAAVTPAYKNSVALETDSDLAVLRSMSDFAKALKQVKAK